MSAKSRRNRIDEENHSTEYLLYGRFHLPEDEEGPDELGYRSKRWTSLAALEDLDPKELQEAVSSFILRAKDAHENFVADESEEQADKQVGEQADKQTVGEQVGEQAVEQAVEPAGEQAGEQAGEHRRA